MFPIKLAAAIFFIATPVLGHTPQGYGYGDMTDTVFEASTDSPAYTNTPYPVVPLTITDSVTLTKPVTVTITQTVTLSRPKCSLDVTTISGTTSTTITTEISIFVPAGPSSGAMTTKNTSAPEISGEEVSTVTISTATVSTTNFLASDTSTSCESTTTTVDVDGVTDSPSSTSTSASTLPDLETSGVRSGTSNGTTGLSATRTSSSMVPLPTIVTSTGVKWMVDAQFVAGAAVLASWILTLTV